MQTVEWIIIVDAMSIHSCFFIQYDNEQFIISIIFFNFICIFFKYEMRKQKSRSHFNHVAFNSSIKHTIF